MGGGDSGAAARTRCQSRRPDLLLGLGITLVRAGRDTSAVAPLTEVTRQLPRNYRAEYYLGLTAQRAGWVAQARQHLRRFIQLAPGDYDEQIAGVRQLLASLPEAPP